MNLNPSDRAQLTAVALRYLAERLGLAQSDAKLSLQFETLTGAKCVLRIEALSPEVIDYLAEIQSELVRRAYLATGVSYIDIRFLDQLILSFAVGCESFDTSATSPMVATLEKPEALDLPVLENTQVELPLTDAQIKSEPEELCTIEDLIDHVSRRTNQNADSLRSTINSMNLQRYLVRGQELVSTKAIAKILQRWAEVVACDVQMSLHYQEIAPKEPLKTVAKKPAAKKSTPAKKTATRKTGTKKPLAEVPAAEQV